jgi:cytoskeletal protein RodZ
MSTGVEFRALRESRGLSVDRIATATRIPVRMIEAIERDDLHALPARPYLRGFVAAYGRELGLDPADAVTRYFSDHEPPVETLTIPEPVAEPEGRTGRVLIVAGVMLALLFVIPSVNRWRSTAEIPQLPVTGTSGSAPAVSKASNLSPSTPAAAARADAVSAAAASSPAATDQGALVPAQAVLVVSLTFTRPCWLTASADGTRIAYRTMEAGATQVVKARDTIALRVGDAGAVTWTINGRAPAPMGRDGEVRTFLVTPANSASIK